MKNKGFTLIEILVVVLIVGILVSIVLPQYRLAVEKTKLSKYLSIGQSIRNAQEVFYMNNGIYSPSLSALDIDIESLCESRAGHDNIYFNCMDKSIQIDNACAYSEATGAVSINYCSSLANTTQSSWGECKNNKDLSITFYYANYSQANKRNKITCKGHTDKGNQLCKTIGY